MALNLETLNVALRLDGSSFQTGMAQADSRLDGFRDRLGRIGDTLTSFGQRMTGFVTLPIVAGFGTIIGAASNLEEAQNKVAVVFADSADEVLAWSKANANAYGLSQAAALDAAGTFGNVLTSMGFTTDAAEEMSTGFIGLAGDLSSFNNVPVPEALAVIQSGLIGEYEPLRQFGVILSEAEVQSYALANGIWNGTGAMTEQQKVLARQGLIWEQTTNAQGDALRTQNSWANMQRRIQAKLLDVAAALGKHLLPSVVNLGKRFEGLIDWFEKLSPATQKWMLAIAAVAAALGPVLIVLGMMASGLAVLIGPLGLIAAAVALLAMAWIQNWGDIQGKTAAVVTFIRDHLQQIVTAFTIISGPIGLVIAAIVRNWNTIVEAFQSDGVVGGIRAIGSAIASEFGRALAFIQNIVGAIRNVDWSGFLAGAWDAIQTGIELAWDAITSIDWSEFIPDVDWGALLSKAGDLGTALIAHITSLITSVEWTDLFTKAASLGAQVGGHIVSLVTSVDWKELFTKAGSLAATIGGHLISLIMTVDWMDLFTKASALDEKIGEHIKGLIVSVDWMNLFTRAAEIGGQVSGHIISLIVSVDWMSLFTKAGSLATTVGGHIVSLITAVDWLALFTKGGSLANPMVGHLTKLITSVDWMDLFTKGGSLATRIGSHLIGKITSVDWTAMFTTAGELGTGLLNHIKSLIVSVDWTALFGEAIDLGGELLTWITEQIGDINPFPDWPSPEEILDAIVDKVSGGGAGLSDEQLAEGEKTGKPGVSPGGGRGPFHSLDPALFLPLDRIRAAVDGLDELKAAFQGTQAAIDISMSSIKASVTNRLNESVIAAQASAPAMGLAGLAVGKALGISVGSGADSTRPIVNASALKLVDTARSTSGAGAQAGTFVGNTFGRSEGTGMTAMGGTIFSAASGLVDRARSTLGQAGGAGTTVGNTFGRSEASGISGMGGAVAGASSGLVRSAAGAGGGAGAAGRGIGSALGSGVVAGIAAQAAAAAAAAGNLVRNAISAAMSAGGINSPSTVMRDQVGRQLARGAELGILMGLPAIYDAADKMVRVPDLSSVTAGMSGGSSVDGGHSQRPIVQNIYYSVTPTELQKLIRDAEDGGVFARQFGSEIAMRGGHG